MAPPPQPAQKAEWGDVYPTWGGNTGKGNKAPLSLLVEGWNLTSILEEQGTPPSLDVSEGKRIHSSDFLTVMSNQ